MDTTRFLPSIGDRPLRALPTAVEPMNLTFPTTGPVMNSAPMSLADSLKRLSAQLETPTYWRSMPHTKKQQDGGDAPVWLTLQEIDLDQYRQRQTVM